MDGVVAGGHRRIDRVLAADYLAGLQQLPLADVRVLRDDAEQEETDLSYLRRLLQARLDLVGAEIARREAGGGEPTDLVAHLSRVLADGARPPARGSGRHTTVEPSRTGRSRRQAEALTADTLLADLPAASDEGLEAARDQLARSERSVSDQRAAVQTVLDTLTGEIARRYRDGEASVESLLSEVGQPG